MNEYVIETVMIISTKSMKTTEEKEALIKEYTDLFQRFSSDRKIKLTDIGIKKLAYGIKEHMLGYYITVLWAAPTGKEMREISEQFDRDDRILKHISIKTDDFVEELELLEPEPESKPEAVPNEQYNKNINALDVLLGLAEYLPNQK